MGIYFNVYGNNIALMDNLFRSVAIKNNNFNTVSDAIHNMAIA